MATVANAKKVTSDKTQETGKTATKAVSSAKVSTVKEKTAVVKVETKAGSLSVPMISLIGASAGTLSLPKDIFGAEINKALLAQAIRVYSTNRQFQPGNTKTRGEVVGSTRKIYRQKGTGGARHGAKKAPIFVGGGITFGPKGRKTILELPKKMKKAALISALSQKVQMGEILGLDGLEKATGKTKQMAKLMESVSSIKDQNKKKNISALFIVDQKMEQAGRAVRNIQGVTFATVSQLNAYEVIRHQSLVLTKAAVESLQKGSYKSDETGKAEKPVKSETATVSEPVKKTRKAK